MNAYKLYKAGRWLYLHHIPILPRIVKGMIYLIHNSSISYETEIGKDCKFLYGGIGVVIGKDTRIGDEVIIGTNVLTGGKSNKQGMPKIGNHVYIATGAKVLGNITIGDNVIIGANAVVTHDVPSNCSVAGVPARILKENIDVDEYCSLGRYFSHTSNDNERKKTVQINYKGDTSALFCNTIDE